MTIRIVSSEQVRFDVDVESYNRIVRDITLHVTARCEEQINQMIANGISSELSQSISESICL